MQNHFQKYANYWQDVRVEASALEKVHDSLRPIKQSGASNPPLEAKKLIASKESSDSVVSLPRSTRLQWFVTRLDLSLDHFMIS
ncbi:MAG: hypothetical protein AB8B55_23105 [Mariniblastus sp.]